jgi:exportin-2 (importin alpha re-exporter)
MVSLSTPGGPAAKLQSQIGEAVAEIASVDFPERWPNLLDVSYCDRMRLVWVLMLCVAQDMVNSLSPDNFTINNGVLTTAHSIFKQCVKIRVKSHSSLANTRLSVVLRWRSQFRTDHLFLTIKLVLDKFCDPYYALFQVGPCNHMFRKH